MQVLVEQYAAVLQCHLIRSWVMTKKTVPELSHHPEFYNPSFVTFGIAPQPTALKEDQI